MATHIIKPYPSDKPNQFAEEDKATVGLLNELDNLCKGGRKKSDVIFYVNELLNAEKENVSLLTTKLLEQIRDSKAQKEKLKKEITALRRTPEQCYPVLIALDQLSGYNKCLEDVLKLFE